jgi:hypothetical protein
MHGAGGGWLDETKCFAPRTMNAIASALAKFDEWCDYRDFRDFDFREAQLQLARLGEHGRALGLAPATIEKKKRLVWAFFAWLWGGGRPVAGGAPAATGGRGRLVRDHVQNLAHK